MTYGRAVIAALFVLGAAAADDQPKPPLSSAEKLEAIKKGVKDAEEEFRKANSEKPGAKPDEKKIEELYSAFTKKQTEGLTAAVEIAKTDPKSDTGFQALEWVLTNPRSYYLPPGETALKLAAEHHAANPKIGKIVALVGYIGPNEKSNPAAYAAAKKLITAVAEKNPDKTARAQAHLALAYEKRQKFAAAEYAKDPGAEKLATEAEQALEAVLKEDGDAPRLIGEGSGTIGEFVKSELFELKNLRVGKTAPAIAGEDIEGVKFNLSDYQGKVVVLDFWGDW